MEQLSDSLSIKFTDEFKKNLLDKEIGFSLLGYAFYTDNIDIDNFSVSDIDESKIIYNDFKTGNNQLFNMTYIPSLEGTIKDDDNNVVCNYGTYDIQINKGLFSTFPVTIKAIIVYGIGLSEEQTFVTKNERYIAAIIPYEYITPYKPKKIILQLSLSDIIEKPDNLKVEINTAFDKATENIFSQNNNLLNIVDNYVLAPSGDLNINPINEYYGYNVVQANMTILDKTEKINNIWNTTPKVYVGLNGDKDVHNPHIQLISNSGTDYDSVSFTYDSDKRYFSINKDTGIDNINGNIFSDEADSKYTNKFLRINTTGSEYFSANDIFELNDKGNNISGKRPNKENFTFINSIDSSGFNTSNTMLLNSNYIMLGEDSNDDYYYHDDDNITVINSHSAMYLNGCDNNIYIGNIGIKGGYSLKAKSETSGTSWAIPDYKLSGITYIGKNYRTGLSFAKKQAYCFDNVRTIAIHVENNSNEYQINVGIKDNIIPDSAVQTNQVLIGFEGLKVNRANTLEAFKPKNYFNSFQYAEAQVVQPNNTFSIVFGKYNADIFKENIFENISAEMKLSSYIDDYDGTICSSTNGYTYSTDYDEYDSNTVCAYANINEIHFAHTQDSYFVNSNNTGAHNDLSSDEGDYCVNKLLVVGDGHYKQGDIQYAQGTPATYASTATTGYKKNGNDISVYCNNICERINRFSVEKNSLQLIHDINKYSVTQVERIPAMFAVRGKAPLIQQKYYYYHYDISDPTKLINPLYEYKNRFNLQNALYTPDSIYIPLQRSSNDGYRLKFTVLNNFINSTNSEITVPENVIKFNNTLEEQINNRDTFIIYLDGKLNNYVKIDNIKSYLKNRYGNYLTLNEKEIYTFYLININPKFSISFYGDDRTTLTSINPRQSLRVVYNQKENKVYI